jgi:hypothetical protein
VGNFANQYTFSMKVTSAWACVFITVNLACSSSAASLQADAGIASDAATIRVDAGAQCNALVIDGPQVPETSVASPLPSPEGGTIADGTYILSSVTNYNAQGIDGRVFQATLRVKSGILETALRSTGPSSSDGAEIRRTSDLNVSSNKVTFNRTCEYPLPDSGLSTIEYMYTATSSELKLYLGAASGSEQIYTKRK